MIYITGSGQLGQELKKVFTSSKIDFNMFSIEEWDICSTVENEKILSLNPSIVINTAAYTAVDKAETDVKLAYQINADALGSLSEICKVRNIFLIHISTDFVFGKNPVIQDGNLKFWIEKDEAFPVGIYATSKWKGEEMIQNSLDTNYTIIRTSWLYSAYGFNFPRTILKLLADPNRKELKVIEDQLGRPTWAFRLAEFIECLTIKILKKEFVENMYHFSNSGIASWFDFASAIQEIGLEKKLIKERKNIIPISTEDYPTPAERPRFSVMDISTARKLMSIPHWRADLESCLTEEEILKSWVVW